MGFRSLVPHLTHTTLLTLCWEKQAKWLSWLFHQFPRLCGCFTIVYLFYSRLNVSFWWTTGYLWPWADGWSHCQAILWHLSCNVRNRQPRDFPSRVGSLLVSKAGLWWEIPKWSTHAAFHRKSCDTVEMTQMVTQLLWASKWERACRKNKQYAYELKKLT